jgi:hypothetical protein
MPWSRPFDDPISLPGRRELVTLRDARGYIAALPRAKQESPEWQAATKALILATEDRGPLMHAHIGMLKALNRHVVQVFNTSRAKTRIGDDASWRAIDSQTAPSSAARQAGGSGNVPGEEPSRVINSTGGEQME